MSKETKTQGRRGRKILRVLLVLLLVILIVLAIVGFRFRSHIKAAIIWMTTSGEEIQTNIDKAKDEQTQVLNNSGFYASKELDLALQSGSITAEEHTQILLGNVTLEEVLAAKNEQTDEIPDETVGDSSEEKENKPSEDAAVTETPDDSVEDPPEKPVETETPPAAEGNVTEKAPEQEVVPPAKTDDKINTPNAPPAEEPVQNTGDADKRIAELVTKMYVLKSEYTGAVEGIVSSMKAEYSLLPKEQRNLSSKQSIATRYLGTINTMEAQCDAQVNAIVAELRQLLKANGRDEALADAILSTYATEKENTKAYYLSTYGD